MPRPKTCCHLIVLQYMYLIEVTWNFLAYNQLDPTSAVGHGAVIPKGGAQSGHLNKRQRGICTSRLWVCMATLVEFQTEIGVIGIGDQKPRYCILNGLWTRVWSLSPWSILKYMDYCGTGDIRTNNALFKRFISLEILGGIVTEEKGHPPSHLQYRGVQRNMEQNTN